MPQVFDSEVIKGWKTQDLSDQDVKAAKVFASITIWSEAFSWINQPLPKLGGKCFPKTFALEVLMKGEEGQDLAIRYHKIDFRFRCAQLEVTPGIRFQDWIPMQRTISFIRGGPDVFFASYDFRRFLSLRLEVATTDLIFKKKAVKVMNLGEIVALYKNLLPVFQESLKEEGRAVLRKVFMRQKLDPKEAHWLRTWVELMTVEQVEQRVQLQEMWDGLIELLKEEMEPVKKVVEGQRKELIRDLYQYCDSQRKELIEKRNPELWMSLYLFSKDHLYAPLQKLFQTCVALAQAYPPFLKAYEAIHTDEIMQGPIEVHELKEKIAEAKNLRSLPIQDCVTRFLGM